MRVLIISLFAFAATVAAVFYLIVLDQCAVDFYGKNIRASLFTAFLTMAGFLLSVKTFIIIRIKENVYDHQDYLKETLKNPL